MGAGTTLRLFLSARLICNHGAAYAAVSGDLLDVVVDRIDQWPGMPSVLRSSGRNVWWPLSNWRGCDLTCPGRAGELWAP